MVKDLLIMRHGHAKTSSMGNDFRRDLKDKGKRSAQRMGVWLARNNLRPDLVIASPATRAKRTAEKCTKTSGLNVSTIIFHEKLYEASVQTVIDIIRKCSKDVNRLMIVGHNPSLEILTANLANAYLPMQPATLAHFKCDGEWADLNEQNCTLKQLVEAKNLPEFFPFPDLDSPETRSRPAYYYHQSCVVPYRLNDGVLEILIISSSKHKHWVVPKGIHDPGMSAQASAANEAFEEAGAKGVVNDQPLGSYSYAKWDATCDVSVYPMEVTEMLDRDEWEESHRLRRWVRLESAVELIENPDLANIVADLPDFLAKENS